MYNEWQSCVVQGIDEGEVASGCISFSLKRICSNLGLKLGIACQQCTISWYTDSGHFSGISIRFPDSMKFVTSAKG